MNCYLNVSGKCEAYASWASAHPKLSFISDHWVAASFIITALIIYFVMWINFKEKSK